MTEEELYIVNILIFSNGNCAIFDQHGKQMPQFQGIWSEKRKEVYEQIIKQDYDPEIDQNDIYK